MVIAGIGATVALPGGSSQDAKGKLVQGQDGDRGEESLCPVASGPLVSECACVCVSVGQCESEVVAESNMGLRPTD